MAAATMGYQTSHRESLGTRLHQHHTVASLASRADFTESMLENRKRFIAPPTSPRSKRIKVQHAPSDEKVAPSYWNKVQRFTIPEYAYAKPTQSRLTRKTSILSRSKPVKKILVEHETPKRTADAPNYWNQNQRFTIPEYAYEKPTKSRLSETTAGNSRGRNDGPAYSKPFKSRLAERSRSRSSRGGQADYSYDKPPTNRLAESYCDKASPAGYAQAKSTKSNTTACNPRTGGYAMTDSWLDDILNRD